MRLLRGAALLEALVIAAGLAILVAACPSARAQEPEALPTPTATGPGAAPTAHEEGPDDGDSLYNGTDPSRTLQAYQPISQARRPGDTGPELVIRLYTDRIHLARRGAPSRTVPIDASRPVALGELSRAIGDPEYLEERTPGTFDLSATLLQESGTELVISGPDVRTLRLVDRPHVFLGGIGATALIKDTVVTSADRATGEPVRDSADGRPFILYSHGSRLDVTGSEISYLGSDRSSAYGLSWRQGATGTVLDSDIHHCFFGTYTYRAADMEFRRNVFRDNEYYGFDPHDDSTRLVVEDNEAYGNGSHGFIVSRRVTASLIRNNWSHDNGGNGIVLDHHSDDNLVEGNRVEGNRKDGVVVLESDRNVVRTNTIRDNRVGIRVNKSSSDNVIEGNIVQGGDTGIELYDGATRTLVRDTIVEATARAGIVLHGSAGRINGGSVSAGTVGIELGDGSVVEGTHVDAPVRTGVRVLSQASVTLTSVTIRAADIGVHIEPVGLATVLHSVVSAPEPTVGAVGDTAGSTFVVEEADRLPSAARYAPFGIAAIVLGLLLESIRLLHGRKHRRARFSPTHYLSGVARVKTR